MTTMGTTRVEKRKICSTVPTWLSEKCSQCNYCGIVCPHSVIRPFLLTNEELEKAPEGYKAVKAKGKELAGLNWGIQISSDDCTSCEVCVEACPDGCLVMKPYEQTL